MTNSPSYVPRDTHEWSLMFWAQLTRFVTGSRHEGLIGEANGQRVHLDRVGAGGGLIRIERIQSGSYREAARYPFQLSDAAVAVAHVVAKLLRARPRDVIDTMRLADFLRTLQRAPHGASDSGDDAATLHKWAERLLPYMERDPVLTVADALERYYADDRSGRPPPQRPGAQKR
ncbi:MAG: hypothetical protein M3154_10835 [Candidatus Eremiobacteraeota bacterium]|nr:hypothetical protein [Candidatus Eremiobacteraeota bacterium]